MTPLENRVEGQESARTTIVAYLRKEALAWTPDSDRMEVGPILDALADEIEELDLPLFPEEP